MFAPDAIHSLAAPLPRPAAHAPRVSAGGRAALLAALGAVALVAWIATLQRMRGMDAGPGTDLGALGWYLGVWVTMMAAMMLPSEAAASGWRSRPGACPGSRNRPRPTCR